MGPRLVTLEVPDPPGAWAALGLRVTDGEVDLAGVRVRPGAPGVGWTLTGADGPPEIDGIPTRWVPGIPERPPARHPSGIVGLDHVVVLSDDPDRTLEALVGAGLELRRVREAGGGRRQWFLPLGDPTPVLELVGPAPTPGRAVVWGVALVATDLDATARHLGEAAGTVRDAVQPGRRILTVRGRVVGLRTAVAVMSPHPGR